MGWSGHLFYLLSEALVLSLTCRALRNLVYPDSPLLTLPCTLLQLCYTYLPRIVQTLVTLYTILFLTFDL